MNWYYFFTPDYEFWHQHIQYSLGSYFSLVPIEITPSTLILSEGLGHHFIGCPLKLDLVINCIQTNLGSSVLFSDCTLFFSKTRVPQLAEYVNNLAGRFDLVFADNRISSDVNIGLMLINCNRRTLKFWKQIRATFSKNIWDQKLVNKALATQGLLSRLTLSRVSWSVFNPSCIVCGYEFDETYRDCFFAFKQFIYPNSPTRNWNERVNALNRAGFIDNAELALILRPES